MGSSDEPRLHLEEFLKWMTYQTCCEPIPISGASIGVRDSMHGGS